MVQSVIVKKGVYKHFKGNLYEVLYVAIHSETLEEYVVYKSLYCTDDFPKGTIWIRPKKMFLENKMIDGKEIPRFEFIKSSSRPLPSEIPLISSAI